MRPTPSTSRPPSSDAEPSARRVAIRGGLLALGAGAALWASPASSIAQPAALTLTVERQGHALSTWSLERLQRELGVHDIRIKQPEDGSLRTFRCVSLNDLVKRAYGKLDRGDLVFTCTDGYQPVLRGAWLARHQAWLAFASADGKPFTVNDHGKTQALGPFYVVWDNLRDKSLAKDKVSAWPYQVTRMDTTQLEQRYAALTAPAGASEAARRGQDAFMRSCLSCHALHGLGGSIGPALDDPRRVQPLIEQNLLARFLLDPSSVHPGSSMPGLKGKPDAERTAADLIEYLVAMRKGQAPPSKSEQH